MTTLVDIQAQAQSSLQQLFSSLIENQDFIPHPLRSVSAQKKALEQGFQESSHRHFQRLKNAIDLLVHNGQLKVDEKTSERLLSLLKEQNSDQIQQAHTLQDLFSLSDDDMLGFYQHAGELFHQEQVDDTSDLFLLLTTLNPRVAPFWFGLGLAEHAKKQYEAAILAYWMAIQTDEQNLQPLLRCVECLYALNYPKQAEAMQDLYNESCKMK